MQSPEEYLDSRPLDQQPLVTEALVNTQTTQAACYYFKTHLKEFLKMKHEPLLEKGDICTPTKSI